MKKPIIYLAMAFMSFLNVAVAANTYSPAKNHTVFTVNEETSPLCMAICKKDIEVVKKLISYGADVNQFSQGKTPLMLAARYNNVEIIKLLIESGAKLKAKDEKGNTALKYAELSGANDAAAYLREISAKK